MKDGEETIFDCPKGCGGKLIIRTNKLTKEQFLGCSSFPKCRYSQPLEKEMGDEEARSCSNGSRC